MPTPTGTMVGSVSTRLSSAVRSGAAAATPAATQWRRRTSSSSSGAVIWMSATGLSSPLARFGLASTSKPTNRRRGEEGGARWAGSSECGSAPGPPGGNARRSSASSAVREYAVVTRGGADPSGGGGDADRGADRGLTQTSDANARAGGGGAERSGSGGEVPAARPSVRAAAATDSEAAAKAERRIAMTTTRVALFVHNLGPRETTGRFLGPDESSSSRRPIERSRFRRFVGRADGPRAGAHPPRAPSARARTVSRAMFEETSDRWLDDDGVFAGASARRARRVGVAPLAPVPSRLPRDETAKDGNARR
jgi:hypothetical protein